MLKRSIFVLLFLLVFKLITLADEGMWLPTLLGKYNIADMQKKGFKLTADDIYNVNKACMKDAVVIFGRGCTGELVSDKGLIFTNHHCGYGQIQAHSSLEHDYLTDGFWAMSQKDELPNPGLSVQFLVRMEDVSAQVLKGVTPEMEEQARQKAIKQNISVVSKENSSGNKYNVVIKPFYYGNEYYMFIYEEFKDVRLVGAPPSGIGKFGGDTDNWAWPRHTGDFSLFRIYANKNNEPAEYSPDNVPYKPKYFFPVSIKGVKKDDFTMVFGYPGRTTEYLTSYAVKMISETENPHMIAIRRQILDIMGEDMEADRKVRIQYSSKYAGIANYWKKWLGENKGLLKLNAIKKKQELENGFKSWAESSESTKQKYSNLLPQLEELYLKLTPFRLAADYVNEALFGTDIIDIINYADLNVVNVKDSLKPKAIEGLDKYADGFFKDFNLATDKKILAAMLKMYREGAGKDFQPEFYTAVFDKEFKGDYLAFVDEAYSKSVFTDKKKMMDFFTGFTSKKEKKLKKDPLYKMFESFIDVYANVVKNLGQINPKIELLQRTYMAGLREYQKDKIFYPDANSTLRIAYGKVDDYEPNDGVRYNFFTTIDGIIAKDDSAIYDYRVPAKLKELYKKKDYGRYAENGVMKVAFTASNHTTGGNSGSPVLNAEGHLIGINFDRNWEGTMSDIMYDPTQCRNITLDIRYALFIIEKMAGARHLIGEMKIIE